MLVGVMQQPWHSHFSFSVSQTNWFDLLFVMGLIKSDAVQRKTEKLKNLISHQVRVFLAIVEERTITAAAARLSMGKSGVSDVL